MIKLTIGSAVYDDYRIKDTFQAIRLALMEAGLLDQVEFLIVDNKPDSATSELLHDWIARCGIRYIQMPGNVGTSGPRQRIFEEAKGDAVLVLDCHVLLPPSAVVKLLAFYDANPGCNDLLTGPNISDKLDNWTTHYNLGWRKEFFGMWATAWRAPSGEIISAVDEYGTCRFVTLDGQPVNVPAEWNEAKYGAHTKLMRDAGYVALGGNDDDDFAIPAMGLGLFSCRREAWVNFNPNFRGFGGAEHYIHAKFKQRGNCTRSLGFLKWWHDFTQVGHRAPSSLHDKLRNTVVGYQELGLPLDEMRKHFVDDQKRITADDWERLIADPLACAPIRGQATLEDFYRRTKDTKGPLQPHVSKLRKLAEFCQHVTEWSKSKGSLAAFAVALDRPETKLLSYNADSSKLIDEIAGRASFLELHRDEPPAAIEPTDLLFVSGRNETTKQLLQQVADGAPVRKYVVLHDVARFPDLARLCDRILIEQPQWFVMGGSNLSGGLTILSCNEKQRPAKPLIGWLPGNGPGTELKKLLESLGVNAGPTCDCRKRANDMDIMGIEGCKENREIIIGWLREGQERWGWKDKMKAAAKAVQTGLAFKLNPLDPFPGLVDEAIRLAEASPRP